MKPKLTEEDFIGAAKLLGCSVPAIKAVAQVEAPRGGFNPDGSPVTLFEGHHFHRLTRGRFAVQAPDLSYKTWTTKHYGKDWRAEQDRLQRAMELDRESALMSASWGKFQCMGFNHAMVGHPTIQGFINAMYRGEGDHLTMFTRYVITAGLAPALRRGDWEGFAYGYNGKRHAEHRYAPRLAAAFEIFNRSTA